MNKITNKASVSKATNSGFTLIEILVVIGIIAILAGIVLVAVNPGRQFAQARDTQRTSNITTILNAYGQRVADNKGSLNCAGVTIPVSPASAAKIASGVGNIDLGPCLVATYVSSLPFDPSASGAKWTDKTDYDTGYTILQDTAANGSRITIKAPSAEITIPIEITR